LIIISNLQHAQSVVFPELSKQFSSVFLTSLRDELKEVSANVKECTSRLLHTYVRAEAQRIPPIFKRSICSTRAALNDYADLSSIRSYVFDILLEVISVHAKVCQYVRTLLPKVMKSMKKVVMQCFFDYGPNVIEHIDEASVPQLCMEIEFFDRVLSRFASDNAKLSQFNFLDLLKERFGESGFSGSRAFFDFCFYC
jgi:exocyst complex component 2